MERRCLHPDSVEKSDRRLLLVSASKEIVGKDERQDQGDRDLADGKQVRASGGQLMFEPVELLVGAKNLTVVLL